MFKLVKWIVIILVIAAIVGWGNLYDGGKTVVGWISNIIPAAKCWIIPTRADAERIYTEQKSRIDNLLGNFAKDVSITITDNKDCEGKASIAIRSNTLEAVEAVKKNIGESFMNIPITLTNP